MGFYNYKRVMHRDDFLAEAEVYAAECKTEGVEYEGGCDYDGDGWVVTERLLDKKDAEIAALKAELSRREGERTGIRREGGKSEGEFIDGTSGKEESDG